MKRISADFTQEKVRKAVEKYVGIHGASGWLGCYDDIYLKMPEDAEKAGIAAVKKFYYDAIDKWGGIRTKHKLPV